MHQCSTDWGTGVLATGPGRRRSSTGRARCPARVAELAASLRGDACGKSLNIRRCEEETMTVASPVLSVLAGLGAVRGWQEDFYRDLHRHPELSHQERRTAAKVGERLGQAGYRVHRGVGGTGVVGVLGSGDGPTVLLRADMDALPVREATDLPYASTVATPDAS